MGRYHRARPERLAEKLLRIRTALGLSQNEMLRHLGLDEEMTRGRISGYELGTREPSLPTLLRYARSAGLCVDDLIDDELELPKRIPGLARHPRRTSK
jgi:transcriptional regulator with XRE-family HTH domain